MELVYQMEKQLYHDNIISLGNDSNDAPENNYSNKSVIQLESTLLKMASNTNLCNGVLYIFPVPWLTTHLLGISTLITFPYNYFLSFKTN